MDAENYNNVSGKSDIDFMLSDKINISESTRDINFFGIHPFSSQIRNPQKMSSIQFIRPTSIIRKPNICSSRYTYEEDKKYNECSTINESFCHVKLVSFQFP